ncbi:LytR/AlgR family response regulator transcription factor [Bacillus velezensis]|uniref:LytR/AlgR family response regulator transcription factor n=1 Tax=Bacillus velezensis TaxID=492670 RepID=UPI0020B87B1F|nr:LytTR family DNA-binding domain-containing protein [Bacillus velezensis]UTH88991.1 LytTR family transcriptional regulator DNA-binding domain-containing protein [Bacillus velezensis]
MIKNKGLSKFIDIEDINYIEKKKDNTKIHLVNEEIIDSKESLNDLEIKLQSYGFFRIHQSYIVPFKKIEEIKPDNYMKSYNLKLKDTDEILSLSRNKYKILKDMLFD